MNDLSQQTNKQNPYAFNKATQSIKDWVPKQFEEFKNQVIHLISRMYFEKDDCKLQIQFNATFYDPKTIKRHWIPEFYENINKQSNPRLFMQQQLKQADLSFAVKSRDQLQEITAICGMARLLFEIFCDCQFVPTAYVILLAILMDTQESVNYDATIIHLENEWVIDLSLQSGIAVLNPTIGITPAMPTEPETNQYHQDPVLHVQVASSQSHLHTSMEAKRESQPDPGRFLKNNIFLSTLNFSNSFIKDLETLFFLFSSIIQLLCRIFSFLIILSLDAFLTCLIGKSIFWGRFMLSIIPLVMSILAFMDIKLSLLSLMSDLHLDLNVVRLISRKANFSKNPNFSIGLMFIKELTAS